MLIPDYTGATIANLVSELERRLVGTSPNPGLHPFIASEIPPADTYVVVLFDGLGDRQLDHPDAGGFRSARVSEIHAVFPTTTSAGLASLATGLPPRGHGIVAHQLLLDGVVVNTLKWKTLGGDPVRFDTAGMLPSPNLWERLAAGGAEPLTVQAGSFQGSPLSRAMYRGCRFEPVWSYEELVLAVTQLAATRRRLILTYVPDVDFAAHVHGLRSDEYGAAVRLAVDVWDRIASRLPDGTVMIGTADHGLIDTLPERKVPLPRPKGLRYYGDPRVVLVKGDPDLARPLTENLPARFVDRSTVVGWWGPGPAHPDLEGRTPDGAFVADDGYVLLPHGMDRRMVGYHGGLDEREVLIPLLVASP